MSMAPPPVPSPSLMGSSPTSNGLVPTAFVGNTRLTLHEANAIRFEACPSVPSGAFRFRLPSPCVASFFCRFPSKHFFSTKMIALAVFPSPRAARPIRCQIAQRLALTFHWITSDILDYLDVSYHSKCIGDAKPPEIASLEGLVFVQAIRRCHGRMKPTDSRTELLG